MHEAKLDKQHLLHAAALSLSEPQMKDLKEVYDNTKQRENNSNHIWTSSNKRVVISSVSTHLTLPSKGQH